MIKKYRKKPLTIESIQFADNAGVHLSASIPVMEIPFFVCDVVQSVRIAQEQKQAEEEMKK